jgi:hypothetical protein
MYPVLVVGGGTCTVLWDNLHVILARPRKLLDKRRRRTQGNDIPLTTTTSISPSTTATPVRDVSPEQEVDRVERIELPVLGSGAEDQDIIRPVGPEPPRPVYMGMDSKPNVQPELEDGKNEMRQRQVVKERTEPIPTTATLEASDAEQMEEEIHTLPAKTAAAIFVLFVTLVVTFVVLKTTLTNPGRELGLFTK